MAEYIEREAAIVKLCQISDATSHDYAAGISVAVDAIDLLPAADVVPVVHGKWIDEGRMRHCSVCGRRKYFKENYCPNCGTRMDGDGDV